jgi:hypothetical protein
MSANTCKHCSQPLPVNLFQCPHCGEQAEFPNVAAAATKEETTVLDARLREALDELKTRRAEKNGEEFAISLESAEAVISRYFGELFRLAWSDDQIYATYYQKIQAGLQNPEGDRWNRLRGIDDEIFFGANKQHIRFAALSLNGVGLDNYGDCSMTIKRSMIEHRATAFEENLVIFMKRHGINGVDDYEVPRGYRATWARRIDLCVAKLASNIHPATLPREHAGILLSRGASPDDDKFVEVHIWGPLTIRSFERVVVKKWATAPSLAEKLVVKIRLDHVGLKFDTP